MKQQRSNYRNVELWANVKLTRDTKKEIIRERDVFVRHWNGTSHINGEALNARGRINRKIDTAKIKPVVLILVALWFHLWSLVGRFVPPVSTCSVLNPFAEHYTGKMYEGNIDSHCPPRKLSPFFSFCQWLPRRKTCNWPTRVSIR